MHKFRYGNVADSTVYLDEQNIRMIRTLRMLFSRLASALIDEGQKEKAKEVLDYSFEVLPTNTIPADVAVLMLASNYYELGETERADELMDIVGTDAVEKIEWVIKLPRKKQGNVSSDMNLRQNVGLLQNIYYDMARVQSPLAPKYMELFQKYYPYVAK